jgi:hypothetical protein
MSITSVLGKLFMEDLKANCEIHERRVIREADILNIMWNSVISIISIEQGTVDRLLIDIVIMKGDHGRSRRSNIHRYIS